MDCIPAVPWNSLFVLVAAKSDNRSEKRTAPKGRLSIPQIAFLRRAIPKRPTRPLPNNQTGAGTGIVDTAYAQFTPESDDTLNAIGVPLSSITDWIPSQRSVLPNYTAAEAEAGVEPTIFHAWLCTSKVRMSDWALPRGRRKGQRVDAA
jgi:hypothetical protein